MGPKTVFFTSWMNVVDRRLVARRRRLRWLSVLHRRDFGAAVIKPGDSLNLKPKKSATEKAEEARAAKEKTASGRDGKGADRWATGSRPRGLGSQVEASLVDPGFRCPEPARRGKARERFSV